MGLSEVQERLQDNGLGADDARSLAEGLQAPSEWATWRAVHVTARPPLPHVDRPTPEPAQIQESRSYKFYVSVLGKRSLRRLHRKGGCGTKPEDLIKCEFYETLEGVEFDAECKHCFRPEPAASSSVEGAEPTDEGSSSTSRFLCSLRFVLLCFNGHAPVHGSNNSQAAASHACMLQQLAFQISALAFHAFALHSVLCG